MQNIYILIGGFNPLKNMKVLRKSDWIIIPTIGENKKKHGSKPPTSFSIFPPPGPPWSARGFRSTGVAQRGPLGRSLGCTCGWNFSRFDWKKWRISWDENKNLMVINGDYWEFYGDEWCFSVKMRILSGDIMGIGMKNGYLKSRNIY